MNTGALAAAFVAHLTPDAAFDRSRHGLEEELSSRLAAGAAAWPGVELRPETFAAYLAARVIGAELPAAERAADLYLACACIEADPAALRAFHATFRDAMMAAAHTVSSCRAFADDVLQALSERLLVPVDGEPARIAQYSGRASLRGWLATIAKRTALNLVRGKDEHAKDSLTAAEGGLAETAGPEVLLLKARYKEEFEAAIRSAMAGLPPRDRMLLLLHFVDGVTLPQLAALENVSRATVARWVRAARDALHEETRRQLVGRLGLSPSELASVAALVRSQVEVSLPGAVRTVG